MSDYLADDRPIPEEEFTRRAGDPRASVVVEACAGSGKTWLLVSRIVRILLDGTEPGDILAITFTRRAAQEMRARLLHDLKELAQADDTAVVAFLRQRGLSSPAAHAAIDPARRLYERVVTARVPLTIETFHGWFWRLLARAPLGSGVPFAPVLLESIDRLRADAWLQFTAALTRPQHSAERAAWEWLIDDIGDFSAKLLLQQFLHKRAEWWAFAAGDEDDAVVRALAPLQAAGTADPCVRVRDPEFVAAVRVLGELWASIAPSQAMIEQAAERARRWLASVGSVPARDFRSACLIALTKSELTPIIALRPDRISTKLATLRQVTRYAEAHALVIDRLQQLLAARRTWRALKLNEAGLRCGRLFVEAYQRLKEQEQALDFTDLEWHVHRLLLDPDHAAYMQARLDARYRHILLDEFQDTNPLQWQILQSWLAAYGPRDEAESADGAADRPNVFIVGDPKQSIYRFRRAEPRVFDAALDLLQRDYGATHLRTNVTRRNSRTVVAVLNRAMPGHNPLYQVQSTLAPRVGSFVLLPLAQGVPAVAGDEDAVLRDVLNVPRTERDTGTRYREGRVFANEIAHWVEQGQVTAGDGERLARWSDVLVLVRRRTHLIEYERALRDAGVPFISDRRGGLLATLEADDLTALLGFLTSPFADLKLAHALRSPIFG
ncbi:MAG: UvrD-helicase domain-containing protein, partial [Burkholderiaceae bacterium]